MLPEECQVLHRALNEDLSIVQSSGFEVAGQKYVHATFHDHDE